jgi:PAP2 superfamily
MDFSSQSTPKATSVARFLLETCLSRAKNLTKDENFVAVTTFSLAALLWNPSTYLQLAAHYLEVFPAINLLVLFILIIRGILISPRAPLAGLVDGAKRLRFKHIGMMALIVGFLSAFTTFKLSIPSVTPFFADPYIAAFDLWLHGDDPWKYARMLPVGTSMLVDFVYSKLWFGVALCSLIHAALLRPGPEFRRLIMATLLIYIVLGVVLATALSSVGPIFYDRFYAEPRFAEFTAMLAADPYATQQKFYMEYLYSAATTNTALIGSGISAMPSIHVGVAVIVAWYMTSQGRISMIAGWAFAGIILFGSVYTGWHYAADGYLSAIAATLFWWMASRRCALGLILWRRGPKLLGGGGKIESAINRDRTA